MAPAADTEKAHTILETIELSDESDDEFAYEELPEEQELMQDEEETLDDINRLLAESRPSDEVPQGGVAGGDGPAKVQQRPQVIDDFFRNFLIKSGMKRSLETFQMEWYELQQSGKFKNSELEIVPDIYTRNHGLHEEVVMLRTEVEKARQVASTAKQSWDKFRKERDYHRMHHRRVVQEKNKLIVDLRRLKKHYEQYEPTLTELKHKYEVAMKEKMLMRLERDRFASKVETLQKQLSQVQADSKDDGQNASKELQDQTARRTRQAPWPSDDRANPYANSSFAAARLSDFKKTQSFKGHMGAVSRIAFHPKLPVVATACDDHTWKMWSMPGGELVLSGEGHRDWVSGVAFHPRGSLVATTSGDTTVKIWDVEKERCRHTLTDHNQAVWACAFHDLGDFVVTCSMDQTTKAFDMTSMRCRQTFRGHVDSVNYVTFQPFSNNVLTASGDKTVSMWDLRTGLCVQTFYGHQNSCNHAVFNRKGDTIASCDSDGVVKLWDVRVVSEYVHIETGNHPANAAAFDRSGKMLAVASGDSYIKGFNVEDRTPLGNLEGHEDSVQDVCFEPTGDKYLLSASSDASFALWS